MASSTPYHPAAAGSSAGPPATDDAILLQRYVKERDERAFAELVRRHVDGVYASALRRLGGDAHLAEDVVQQVFVFAARSAARIAPGPPLTGWLYATTRNVAANLVRDERRRKAREQQAHAMENILHAAAPEAPPDWGRVAPVLDAALDDLREGDRQVVLWRYIDRRPFAEIGAALRLTEDAARMRVERALEKLRACLARRGIASTSAALGVALAQNIATAAPASLAALATQAAIGAAPLAAGGSVALFFHVTMQAKLTTAVAAGLALLACGTATWQVCAHRAAERELAAARREPTAPSASRLAVATSAVPPARATAPSTLPAAPSPAPTDTWDGAKAGAALMDRVPGFREALVEAYRAEINLEYADFFKAERLTPQQIEDFGTMMVAGRSESRMMGADGQTYSFSPRQGERVAFEPARILGEGGAERFDAFETARFRDQSIRGAVAQLARALCFSEEALTLAQAGDLKKILEQQQVPPQPENESLPRFQWDKVFAEAGPVLRPAQLDALRGVVIKERGSRAMSSP